MSMILDGSNGVTFNDSSLQGAAASPYTLKNRIINGSMVVDQRNAGASKSYSASTITYAVDRFFLYPTGAAVTGQQVAGTNTGTGYAFRITGATGNTACNFSQRIENLNTLDLNSTSVTISFKAYASTSISNIQIGVYCGTSTNAGYGSGNNAFSSVFSLASGLNTISQTITLPSTASNGFEFAIGFGSGIGNTVTVDISNVQLEIGSSATPFERRLYNQELANCQRYLPATYLSAHPGWCYATTGAIFAAPFAVPSRVYPSGLSVTPASCIVYNGGLTTAIPSAIAWNGATVYEGNFSTTTSAILTLGQSGGFSGNILWTGCEL